MIRLRVSRLTFVSALVLAACSTSHQRSQPNLDAGLNGGGDSSMEHRDAGAADGGESADLDASMIADSGGMAVAGNGGAAAGATGSAGSAAAE